MCVSELTQNPESVHSPMQGEKGPQDLRGVHTEEAATSHSIHPVVHLSSRQQAEAEYVSGARHREATVHDPILFAIQENIRVCGQVPGVQRGRVAGRQTKQQRAKVRQPEVANFHVQSLAHVQRPVAEHQSPTAVQKADPGCRAVGRERYIGASDRVKVQVIVQRGRKAAARPRDAESSGSR